MFIIFRVLLCILFNYVYVGDFIHILHELNYYVLYAMGNNSAQGLSSHAPIKAFIA